MLEKTKCFVFKCLIVLFLIFNSTSPVFLFYDPHASQDTFGNTELNVTVTALY